jgi:hypothetical protein
MKTLIIIIMSVILTNSDFAQPAEHIKTHLFLGNWETEKGSSVIIESWRVINDSEFSGESYTIKGNDSILTEKLSLRYINEKLCYCPTVIGQNNKKEIVFPLKTTENNGRKFIFENPSLDFPQRIIYDFESQIKLNASIEGDNLNEFHQINFEYKRKIDLLNFYKLTGTIRKENFVNKVGKKVEGYYDYFFEIQGVKYFIKLKDSEVLLTELIKYIDKPVKLNYSIRQGLWDTDDPNVQSRVGIYLVIFSIEE